MGNHKCILIETIAAYNEKINSYTKSLTMIKHLLEQIKVNHDRLLEDPLKTED